MADWSFIVKNNKSAQRCEVCHKSDLFDPQTGICQRCQLLPIEKLANPDIYSIYTIPASRFASAVAASLALCCFAGTLLTLSILFHHAPFMMTPPLYVGMLAMDLLVFPFSIALNRWCKDDYNERLDYRIVVLGKFCSMLGIIGSPFGLACAIMHIIV
jgi:hypothetical protein